MAEFLFGTWPDGVGPVIVQLVLVIGGVAAGIRGVDDAKAWRAARSRAKERSGS